MALVPRNQATSRSFGFGVAVIVPLAVYIATASPFAYWLDGGEFVAASAGLGISHPPGHPLAALVGAIPSLLPFGSLALRVALASSLLAALAAGALFLAAETTVRAVGVASPWISVPLALGAAWTTAFSYGFWFQAVRTEVYALEAALIFLALDRIVALEAAWPTTRITPLYVAAFLVGLALTNHHFLAFLVLPAVAPTLARVHSSRGFRPLLICAASGLFALVTYAYLPIRAHAAPTLNLGAPTDAARLLWVVSAKTFQKNTGGGVPEPLGARFADVFVQLVDSVGWPTLLLAILGLYVLLRTPGARRIGVVWALVIGVFVPARAWLGFVRNNPDALGYLMPALGALAICATAFVAIALTMLGRARDERPGVVSYAFAAAAMAHALHHGWVAMPRSSLATFADTDAVDEVLFRALPNRAVLFAFDPQTVFRAYDFAVSDASRPDVLVVPMPFLTYPGLADALIDEEPRLAGVVRRYLLDGELARGELESLASARPTLIELDVRVGTEVFAALVPHGFVYRALPMEASSEDRVLGAKTQEVAWARLRALLPATHDAETRNRLLWHRYMDALYFAATGERALAKESLVHAMEINPKAAELLALDEALETAPGKGAMDVTPFLPSKLE